ncbi:cyclin-dependent kinase 4 inhibitor D isoform X2 [Phyllopteryx taeniolatus]|uniref:cyclin-dependent kinase 4 inhibitor D n=1 Tax=Phycodurus eques TaxID=693459 RepID=UPI002ACDA5E9|nr:cyclin-dependent kinase 4 inhibitor D [Phycodurus eques]XP_061627481.1 cyclin-dependent kinase 4 inhibitor D isoform X2 [Phyllopteryx taeniolatus]
MVQMHDARRLATAAGRGKHDEVRRILDDGGVHPDAVNEFGRTPLQVMMMGNAEVARLLLESGANPNVQDSSGIAPIHDAARSGFVATLRVLVEYGALVNVADHFGALPIHIAIREGHRDAVEFLAPCSDLWHTNARGQTPVDVARASRRPDMIHLLLAHI